MATTIAHTFSLLVPTHIKTVHLLGSWDNYARRYEMTPPSPSSSSPPSPSSPSSSAATSSTWRMTLRFPDSGSNSTKRYWFYFILDGYFESHDPNMPTTKEPTRGIILNVLDLIRSGASSPDYCSSHSQQQQQQYYRSSSSSSQSSGYHSRKPAPQSYTSSTSSPVYTQAHRASIIAPKPRNPLAAHKLTLDTDYHRRYTAYSGHGSSSSSPSSSLPRSSYYSSSPSSSSSSDIDYDSPVTPIEGGSDCECNNCGYEGEEGGYASDSSHEEYSCVVRPVGKYAYPVGLGVKGPKKRSEGGLRVIY